MLTGQNGILNIYDLAGNVWEWTLEYTSNSDYPCAYRGSAYDYFGSFYSSSYRDGFDTNFYSNEIGFRSVIYQKK